MDLEGGPESIVLLSFSLFKIQNKKMKDILIFQISLLYQD